MITIYTRPGVSMHLLVLSAFRHDHRQPGNHSQDPVSMHLLVLSAFRHDSGRAALDYEGMSQCTFWCSVLSDRNIGFEDAPFWAVSMHLLVLSAFRREYAA